MSTSTLQNHLVWPTPTDALHTDSSWDQLDTENAIDDLFTPYRTGTRKHTSVALQELPDAGVLPTTTDTSSSSSNDALPLPALRRSAHIKFLNSMLEPLPAPYVAFDANRAWLLYWVFHSRDLLHCPLEASLASRAVSTLLAFQNPRGGFGGGPGQVAHLMSTYAAVCALSIVGGPGEGGGWEEIDRTAMYDWMLSLKQPDGSFTVTLGGEVDIRASYCVICVSLLLGICTAELVRGMGAFVARCQTYEGGLAAASFPGSLVQPSLGEAHGGYASCGVATHLALSLLPASPPTGAPHTHTHTRSAASASLSLPLLLHWATSQQGAPIEGGGFRGRTNKLVDGCYGWFAGGGMFACLESLVGLEDESEAGQVQKVGEEEETVVPVEGDADDWSSATTTTTTTTTSPSPIAAALYDAPALQTYILLAAQDTVGGGGGLRDKPGKRPDAYHTCYNLSGLSAAQLPIRPSRASLRSYEGEYNATRTRIRGADDEEEEEAAAWRARCFGALLCFRRSGDKVVLGPRENELMPTHPIVNVGLGRVERMVRWSYGVQGR